MIPELNSKRLRLNITTILLYAVFTSSCGISNNTDKKIEQSRRVIEDLMNEQQVVGLSVTVIHEGKKVWSEGFGFANLENEKEVDPGKTMFRIGSVSKPMTSTAVAKLYEEGKLDLAEHVSAYVDYFPPKRYPITVKHVAGHTSGTRHYSGDPIEYYNKKRFKTVKESISIFQDDTLLFKPGEKFKYSSFGYNLLSAVIEGASSQIYLDYLQEQVFDQLEMDHTSADFSDSILIGRSGFYQFDTLSKKIMNTEFVDNSYKWAGGGFLSTSEDIAKFGWAFHSGQIVSDTTKQLFIKEQKLSNGETVKYGLGWTNVGTDDDGNRSYGHGGTAVGGKALVRIYLDHNLVIAMASNTWKTRGDQEAVQQIAKIFIRE